MQKTKHDRDDGHNHIITAIHSYGGEAAIASAATDAKWVAMVFELLAECGKNCPLNPMDIASSSWKTNH